MSNAEPEGWEQPGLVPARMVNEFSYCERLFYIEWVQARFADNDDTVEGRWVHRVVDAESKPDSDSDRPSVARSLLLSSDELGVICRTDLVEMSGRTAVPVDYKRGAPPENPERSWEPERVQLCLQGLLLREAGYVCDYGILYFAGSKTRVRVPLTDQLIERTLDIVRQIRLVAGSAQAPEPLIDSPKCQR